MKKMIVIILLLAFLVGCSNENKEAIDASDEGRVYIGGTHFSIVPMDGFVTSNISSGLDSEKYKASVNFIELPIEYSQDEFIAYSENLIETQQDLEGIDFISSESISENEILVTAELEIDLDVMRQLILMKYNGKDIVGQIHVTLYKDEYEVIKDDVYEMLKSIRVEDKVMDDFERNYAIDLPKDWKLAENMFGIHHYSLSGSLAHDNEEALLSIFSAPSSFDSKDGFDDFIIKNTIDKKNYKDIVVSSSKDMDINGALAHIYYIDGDNEITKEEEYFQYCFMMLDDSFVVIQGNGKGMLSNENFEEIVATYKLK